MANFAFKYSRVVIGKFLLAYMPYLIIGLVAILLHILPELVHILEYNREEVYHGQLWRLFTGHLLHTNTYHLWLNCAALALLALLHQKFYSLVTLVTFFLLSALIVSVAIYLFTPSMQYYVGLSGVLHGLFILGALHDIKNNDKTGYLLLAGIIIKVAHEQIYGASDSLIQLINADVAIDAHLYGVCSGGCFFIFQQLHRIYLAKL